MPVCYMSGGMKLVHETAFDKSGCVMCNTSQNPDICYYMHGYISTTSVRTPQKSFITVASFLPDFVTCNTYIQIKSAGYAAALNQGKLKKFDNMCSRCPDKDSDVKIDYRKRRILSLKI